jgi:hypothetical protein
LDRLAEHPHPDKGFAMRRIFLLAIVVLVLVGSGLLTIRWSGDSATIEFDRQRAKEETARLLERAREIGHEMRENRDQGEAQSAAR